MQAEGRLRAAIELVGVYVQNLLARPGEGSSRRGEAKSVRRESETRAARRDSQRKQGLLQSGAADDDIPEGVAERLHFHMGQADSCGQNRWRSWGLQECGKVWNGKSWKAAKI